MVRTARGTSPGTSPRKPKPARPSRVSGAVPYQPKMTKAAAQEAVETNLGARVTLSDFRTTSVNLKLSAEERQTIIDQAAAVLEHVFVHLPLKRAMHVTEPVQRLRLLRLRHPTMDERTFQSEMIDIFTDLRDLHTNYVLPLGYRSKFAFLPFRIEEFYEDPGNQRKYLVTWVSPVSTDRNLKVGAVVTHWNGSPVDLAVARNSEREAGCNPDARRARGIEALTLRWLGMSLPPDEDWVTLTYLDGNTTRESRFDWEIVDRPDLALLQGTAGETAVAWGIDLKTALLHEVRKSAFGPQAVQVEKQAQENLAAAPVAEAAIAAPPVRAEVSHMPDVYPRFGPVETRSGTFGYIRLRTFAPKSGNIPAAVAEFRRLLGLVPAEGLILDVRGNGGGYINFGERILQMLAPRTITPEPFHFLSTALTHGMATANPWFGQWREAIGQAIETGSPFSQGFPLTPPDSCNDVGQIYQGPVVLVTDALCYSTTDIFAAGFQDHNVGTILGVHDNTGAGGANVVDHDFLTGTPIDPRNPFEPLPQGASMRTAFRRSTRIGLRSGVPLEDLGVSPDVRYFTSRNDLLNNNADMIATAAALLAGMDRQTLRLSVVVGPPPGGEAGMKLRVESTNLDRIDILLEGRAIHTEDITTPAMEIELKHPVLPGSLLVGQGYRGGILVVSTRILA